MLKDIPYSTLKQDERTYKIMLLRDQQGSTFAQIAKECERSVSLVAQFYHRMKVQQARLYIHHIAFSLGHDNTAEIRGEYSAALEFYQEYAHACGYLEKKYDGILTAYRHGEPGMAPSFLETLPPFQPQLSEETIARIVEMRETKKASFVAIGKEFQITREKAARTYDMFYHEKVLEIVEALQEKAPSYKEKQDIWDTVFRVHRSPKVRYEQLTGK